MQKKEMASVVLIGDVVGSRAAGNRRTVHARLRDALDAVNEELAPVEPLRITVGDEYQGTFTHLGDAIAATLRLRLALLPDLDVRHGLGCGKVEVLEASPRVEDGPGWWAARAAIEEVAVEEERPALRTLRTAYQLADGAHGPDPELVNGALVGRDGLVGMMSPRALSVLRGLLSGSTQREIAEAEGISASAVSQRVRKDGVGLVVAMDERLRRVR